MAPDTVTYSRNTELSLMAQGHGNLKSCTYLYITWPPLYGVDQPLLFPVVEGFCHPSLFHHSHLFLCGHEASSGMCTPLPVLLLRRTPSIDQLDRPDVPLHRFFTCHTLFSYHFPVYKGEITFQFPGSEAWLPTGCMQPAELPWVHPLQGRSCVLQTLPLSPCFPRHTGGLLM